ncbi:MAG: hypothetical protein IPO19_10900 [Rhodoferax sp.]|nr:hypothetical protein [Rhodoferax sp.]
MNKLSSWIKASAVTLGLCCTVVGAQAALLTATDSTFGSFDASSGTRTLALGAGLVSDVNILIDFAKCDDPSIGAGGTACIGTGPSFNSEIVFRLTSPGGTTVNLVNAGTYSGSTPGTGRVSVGLDDEASTAVGAPWSLAAGLSPCRPCRPSTAKTPWVTGPCSSRTPWVWIVWTISARRFP